MNLEEFKEVLRSQMKDYLPESFHNASILFNKTLKNNNIELDTMVISCENQQLIPNIYLNKYLEDINQGIPVIKVLSTMATIYINGIKDNHMEPIQTEFNKMKDNIIVRIVGKELNSKIMNVAPYRIQNDLLVTYRWIAKRDEDGVGSALVTQAMMDKWREEEGVDMEELYQLALENTRRLFPPYITSMEEMIFGLMNEIEDFDNYLPSNKDESIPMYVMTNKDKLNGATVILYPGILEQMGDKLGNDYFILPSSIHEVIVVADDNRVKVDQLRNMVVDINKDMVESEEVLSNSVFRYNRDTKQMKEIVFDMGL